MREIRMMFFIACRPFNTIKNENFEYRIFHRARARKSLLVKLLSRVTIQRRMIKSDRRCYYRLIITSSVRLWRKQKGKKREKKKKKGKEKTTRLLSRDIVSKVNPCEITTSVRRRLKTAKQLLPWTRLRASEERLYSKGSRVFPTLGQVGEGGTQWGALISGNNRKITWGVNACPPHETNWRNKLPFFSRFPLD